MAIQISGSTIIDNSRNVTDAAGIGGTNLNIAGAASSVSGLFVTPAAGAGATVGGVNAGVVTYYGDGSNLEGVTGGGGLGTAINYSDGVTSPFSFINPSVTVTSDIDMDDTNAGVTSAYVVTVEPDVIVGTGVSVTVGGDRKLVIDVLNLGNIE
jgi:hypothetical protein